MRTESEIFSDLANLASQNGFVYVLGWIVLNDNLSIYEGEMEVEDLDNLYTKDRLIRTEISTLAGLMAKNNISFACPTHEVFEDLVAQTYKLMNELHEAILSPTKLDLKAIENKSLPDTSKMLRESFFYDGENAYYFQFRDLVAKKYGADDNWFIENRHFSVYEYEAVIKATCQILQERTELLREIISDSGINLERLLEIYTIKVSRVANLTELSNDTVENILQEFSINENSNSSFTSINDFNEYNAKPLFEMEQGTYLLLQIYSITEAFYDSPFYWMLEDKKYIDQAMENRGNFAEEYTAERMIEVFGKDNVFANVNIGISRKNIVGEIDTLVIFADRAIIVQAKAKRLTIEARKGNDQKIRKDFKASVQDSYDQGLSCAEFLSDSNYKLFDSNDNEIKIEKNFRNIHIFCLVLDPYPSLNFQAREFLEYRTSDVISPPFVLDIFVLDVLAEFLSSPLRFLAYIETRVNYFERVSSTNEFAVLSFHLLRNLFIDDDVHMVLLQDDIASKLDISMMARRDGISGPLTPDGILTRFEGTIYDHLIKSLEHEDNIAANNLGFALLQGSEDSTNLINESIERLVNDAIAHKGNPDFSVGIPNTGITFHCNSLPIEEAHKRLITHCSVKKYSQKSDSWFGVILSPELMPQILFCVHMNEDWEYSKDMEDAANQLFGHKIPRNAGTAPQPPKPKLNRKNRKKRKIASKSRKNNGRK